MKTAAFWGAAVLWTATAQAEVVDRIAAVVNDEVITLTEVYGLGVDFIEERAAAGGGTARARRSAELSVLDSLIQRQLVRDEIDALEMDVTALELDRTIDDIARRNGLDRDTLRAEVERTGMPWAQYREELKDNVRQAKFSQAVIQPRIVVNEDELRDAYRRMVSGEAQDTIVDLGALFLGFPKDADDAARDAVMQRAVAARARVAAGESFSKVSAELDEGPYGKSGGAMGTYRRGELVGDLNVAAFAVDVGGVSAPITSGQGVFLLEVRGRRADATRPFEEVRDQLFERVYSGRIQQETELWVEQARREASVIIRLELAESL